ncbi:MAG: PA14 domain-containing protein, partial [Clostridia bacterium]
FLNYLTTSRMDALRRVLYGGSRVEDSKTKTVLAGSYIPRDAHAWGKSYDPPRDAAVYNISDYTPFSTPSIGTRHLFAVTTRAEAKGTIPQLRVLNDSLFQIWNWVSKEGTAGQDECIGGVACAKAASNGYEMLTTSSFRSLVISTWKKTTNDSTPTDASKMTSFFTANAKKDNLCGSGSIAEINTTGSNNNPFAGQNACTHDNYLTEIVGKIYIPAKGSYKFSVDGDDAVEATINGQTWGWYGGHGNNRDQAAFEQNNRAKSIDFAAAGWYDLRFRHMEGTSGDNWGLAIKVNTPKSEIKDYVVKVETCPSTASLREATCKAYSNNGSTIYKPTGLLHDFGENDKMYFGLITGSYQKNI